MCVCVCGGHAHKHCEQSTENTEKTAFILWLCFRLSVCRCVYGFFLSKQRKCHAASALPRRLFKDHWPHKKPLWPTASATKIRSEEALRYIEHSCHMRFISIFGTNCNWNRWQLSYKQHTHMYSIRQGPSGQQWLDITEKRALNSKNGRNNVDATCNMQLALCVMFML